jgi:hypothetical protein
MWTYLCFDVPLSLRGDGFAAGNCHRAAGSVPCNHGEGQQGRPVSGPRS